MLSRLSLEEPLDNQLTATTIFPEKKPTQKQSLPIMSQPPPSLTLLAERISKSTETIESFLKDKQLPAPSFDADGPKTFPATDENPDILAARDELIDCTQELRDLVVGPTDTIKWRTMTVNPS